MEDEIFALLDYVGDMGLQDLCRGNGHYVFTPTQKGSSHIALNVIHRPLRKSWEISYTVSFGRVHRVVVPEGQLMLKGVPEVRGYLAFLESPEDNVMRTWVMEWEGVKLLVFSCNTRDGSIWVEGVEGNKVSLGTSTGLYDACNVMENLIHSFRKAISGFKDDLS